MKSWIVPLALILSNSPATAAGPPPAQETQRALPHEAALESWREMRFGMFIHWGPVALKGTEIGWSRGKQVPREEYDQLYRSFNPTKFDADEWVRIAKRAGMRYIVLTTKHHDGFCLWDTKQTEYDVMNTPFARDVVKELSAACRREGIAFGTYYSILDWYQPDYNTAGTFGGPGYELPLGAEPSMDRYQDFMHAQLRELAQGYGPLLTFWFDGEWEEPWSMGRGEKLFAFCRELQPNALINNRVGKDRQGMQGTTAQSSQNPGDYDTPEQRVGAFQNQRPWETCMTICQQWAWKPDDEMKSFAECIQTLVRTVGGDGNLLFNVGPMPDGRIEPRQVERLEEMGAWLGRYGESIYGTRSGPFYPDRWGCSTNRGKTVYLHVFESDGDVLYLPALEQRVVSGKVLNGGEVTVEQTEGGIRLQFTGAARDQVDTIVALELDAPVTAMARSRRAPSLLERGAFGEWISQKASYEASSISEKWTLNREQLLTGEEYDGDYSFHTQKEVNPFIVIDLGRQAEVMGLKIVNRLDRSYSERAKSLTLWLSNDGGVWREAWRAEEGLDQWEAPLISPGEPGIRARYLKLGLTDDEPGYLHLHSVKVYGE